MSKGYEEVLAPTLYFDKSFDIDAAKLLPGEYYVTGRNMLLVTVLGSCVAACIRDRKTGVGGMNHFMLPEAADEATAMAGLATRYGTYAMEMLINQIMKMGGSKSSLEAKVFGGGNVLRGFTVSNIGQKNVDFVRSFLDLERIPVVSEDLLDIFPRKVYFFPQTGRVLVKKLKAVHNNTIVEREKDYSSRLQYAKQGGDVDLF
ncbi:MULTISPECIES: chemoreceptor glutamine deamidase CheD [Iodobacter]|jgi:chemotaxis protein CheD|uniref:Probable chemoreceptor glutamine deamidase CheD n=2 Tax=Iodobacter TaxID=32014 RepID=A0A377Q557_9NEIS|nr:chemoreceptor glutamine deamidase CheD [Iodobacter fluviatilis]TCU87054.1 chemotaxis protein CheD [Iodobacter fluviatilis]STQ90386.1 Chemoreceptor glutamine deamidase CheD [Iodobacter fluviatilis]